MVGLGFPGNCSFVESRLVSRRQLHVDRSVLILLHVVTDGVSTVEFPVFLLPRSNLWEDFSSGFRLLGNQRVLDFSGGYTNLFIFLTGDVLLKTSAFPRRLFASCSGEPHPAWGGDCKGHGGGTDPRNHHTRGGVYQFMIPRR